jgi:signal transduction histidine kinase/DNA-binding response OmpR family regulator
MMSSADRVNILIVDDLQEKLLVMETILGELGQNVLCARSGEEALRRVLDHDFAVILLDVNMPGMDGLETASFIRRRKRSAHTPIIFITAFADELHTVQGYSLGAVDYILSPVVPEVLRSKVKVFVDLFRMTQQVRRQADERIALIQEQAARAAAEEATRRSTFLSEASTALASSLDFQTTVRELARRVVPFLADLGAVTCAGEKSHLGETEFAWKDRSGVLRTHGPVSGTYLHASFSRAVARVLASGKTEHLTDLGQLPPLVSEADSTSPPDGSSGESGFPLDSVILQPLRARGHILGVLTLVLGPSGRCFGPSELSLAEDFAGRAAIALDNARLYQEIQQADHRKNEFLAMLAHELRNPLAPIRNAVQVLRLIEMPNVIVQQSRDMIDRQVTHMARLIDDLLDMSRLSRGKVLLRKEPLDLVELVRATAEDYRSTLEGSGLKLHLQIPDRPLYTEGDPTRLAQVVGNVLHNANKFTDPGGRVTVTVATEAEERSVVIGIRDSGIGMEPTMLARVFETFSQADGSLDRSRGGLGLGLALVKGLVHLHGGTVQASSEGLGKGAHLQIRLPLIAQPEAPRGVAPLSGRRGRSHRILVIEDNQDAADSMCQLLTLTGHEVEVASTGSQGLEIARQFRPDVVLCDIGLPHMDGYEVARQLRQDPNLASVYLVAATGYGQEEDQRRSREAGFDVHLIKPVDFADLQRLLAGLHAPESASGSIPSPLTELNRSETP